MNDREVRVMEAEDERDAKIAPPLPLGEVQEVKTDEVIVIDDVKSFNSITDPFPVSRVIFSITARLIVLCVSEEERERKGEERREKLEICEEVQLIMPHPIERMEEEWVREVDGVNSISFNASSPVEVIVRIGDASDTLSVSVKELKSSDSEERNTPNPASAISYRTDDVF